MMIGNINLDEEQCTGRADSAGISFYMLANYINTRQLQRIPAHLSHIIRNEQWKRWRWIDNDFQTSTFEEYITKHPPKGLGASMELVERLIADDASALRLFRLARDGASLKEINQQDEDNEREAGGDHRSQQYRNNVDNKKSDINNGCPTGTSRAAALRRLRRDRPDIHKRVMAGELTAHAGMVEAGFRTKRDRKRLSAFDRVVRLLPTLTDDERRTVHQLTGGD